jgi:hypothetical protein
MTKSRRLLLVALVAVLATTLGACAAGGASPSPSPEDSAPIAVPPTDGNGNDGSDTGGSGDDGVVAPPDDGGAFPPGQPELTVPQPGQQMVHPVSITELLAKVEGRHVFLNARWWSGVEPCSVLDSVDVARDGASIAITLFEGTSDLDAVCIAVAVEKVTLIDLGELEPGSYTISPGMGDAAAIVVEVP